MTTLRRKVKTDLAPVSDKGAAVLLGGWAAEPPGGAPHGFGGGFLELVQLREEGIVGLWRLHERYLRANAQRLGIEPAWDGGAEGLVFFGDYLAFELAQRNVSA